MILTKWICFMMLIIPASLFSQTKADTFLIDSLYNQGYDLYYDGEYEAAKKKFSKTLEYTIALYGENHKYVSDTYYRLGKTEKRLRLYNESLASLNKALEIAILSDGEASKDIAYCLLELGNTFDDMYEFKQANKYYNESIKMFIKLSGRESEDVAIGLMNVGLTMAERGRYRQAKKYLEEAHEIFKKVDKPDSENFNRIYLNLSILYADTENYEKALYYGHKALEVKLKNYKESHPSVPKYYGNLGDIYHDKGDNEKAKEYTEKEYKLGIGYSDPDSPNRAEAYNQMAGYYYANYEDLKALDLYNKARQIYLSNFGENINVALVNANIAITYESQKEFDKARKWYNESLRVYQAQNFSNDNSIAWVKRKMANNEFKQGNFNVAINLLNEVQVLLNTQEDGEEVYIQDDIEYLKTLRAKAKYLQAKATQDGLLATMKQALAVSENAIRWVDKIKRGFHTEKSKIYINQNSSLIVERAVEQAFDIYEKTQDETYLLKAYNFVERNKASVLWSNSKDEYALEASILPTAYKDSLRTLKRTLLSNENLMEGSELDQPLLELRKKQINLEQQYESLIMNLENEFPEYYALKYANPDLDISKIEAKISKHELILNYFYTENYLYTFAHSETGITAHKQKFDTLIEDKIRTIRNLNVSETILDKKSRIAYIESLNFLYNKLIAPIEVQLKDKSDLIIIPHGIFHYLSFEMLADKSDYNDFRQLNYLLKKYTFQYDWSLSLWLQEIKKKINSKYSYVGFAPDFSKPNDSEKLLVSDMNFRANVNTLSANIPEVKTANKYFNGKLFLKDDATELNFLKTAQESSIIHLATHAEGNDLHTTESGLQFAQNNDYSEDGFLNVMEIYPLKLNADLAVLSACNTGYGKFIHGEGIMSIGRAFMYAGCKSVVMSLWLANDQSTAEVVSSFYKYSANGLSKDEALRKAKLDYLENSDAITAHPYYWSNLVAVGEMESLKVPFLNWKKGGFLLLLLGLGVLIWFKRSMA